MKLQQGDTVRLKSRLPTVSEFRVSSIHSGAVAVTCEVAGFTFRGIVPECEVIA